MCRSLFFQNPLLPVKKCPLWKIYGGIGGRPRALDEISIRNVKSIVTEVPSIREHDLRVFVREEYKETKKRKFPELEDTYIKCPN